MAHNSRLYLVLLLSKNLSIDLLQNIFMSTKNLFRVFFLCRAFQRSTTFQVARTVDNDNRFVSFRDKKRLQKIIKCRVAIIAIKSSCHEKLNFSGNRDNRESIIAIIAVGRFTLEHWKLTLEPWGLILEQ